MEELNLTTTEALTETATEAMETMEQVSGGNKLMKGLGGLVIVGAVAYLGYKGVKKGIDWYNSKKQPKEITISEQVEVTEVEEEQC